MSQQQQMKVCSFNLPGQVEPGSLLLRLSWDQTSYNCLHMQNQIGIWNQRTDRALSVLIPHHFRHSLAMHIDTGRKDVAKLQEQQTAVGATDCLWICRHGVGAHWICVHLVFYPLFEQLCGTAEVGGLLFGRNDGKDELDFIKGPFWQSKSTDVIINP